jgi:DNA-binding transcriptional LysR family regulator
MRLGLRQLRHLLALDRYRNFARAAEAVGLTQPALSRSIQALEESLGTRLFDRDRSGIEPTAVGARLIERARPLLQQARDIEMDVRSMIDVGTGLLCIGAGPYSAELSVGTAVGRLVRRHPSLTVDLSVADWPELARRTLAGELDLAVAETSLAQDDDRLVVEALPEHAGCIFCRAGHPLAGKAGATLDDVTEFPLVMTSIPPRMRSVLESSGLRRRESARRDVVATAIHVDNLFLARQVVLESDAVSVGSPGQLAADISAGRLVALPIDMPDLKTVYGIIRLARRTPSPAATAFIEILREVEAGI